MDKQALSERDICTKFITPALRRAGWDEMSQIREEVSFTKGPSAPTISATQIGMTATPKETEYVSNIAYFGEPVYYYSLKQGMVTRTGYGDSGSMKLPSWSWPSLSFPVMRMLLIDAEDDGFLEAVARSP